MEEVKNIPKYGMKVRLDHEYPERRKQVSIYDMLDLRTFLRVLIWYILKYIKKILYGRYFFEFFFFENAKCIYGAPIGGIGGGTIGRGYRGEFCRFQMKPGLYEFETIEANQFIITIKDEEGKTIFQSLLSTFPRKTLKCWESLIDDTQCRYTALYPRSWTEYDLSNYGIKLICRQISPIIPHNYKDSSLPCAVFEWNVQNICEKERNVTISFTFKNGTGNKREDKSSKSCTKSFLYGDCEGVALQQTIDEMPCTYLLSTKSGPNREISRCLYFNPNSNGSKPWSQLKNNGKFEEISLDKTEIKHGEMACGLAVKFKVQPKSEEIVTNSLVWYMPKVHFPMKKKVYNRKYTDHFKGDNAAYKISDYALKSYGTWEKEIFAWQNPILEDKKLPDWFKGAVFNHLYYISDGGTFWFSLDEDEKKNLPKNDPRIEYGRFGYLEGHEYIMYNTYDVHFYSSCALQMNWPHIQATIQYDFKDLIYTEIKWKEHKIFDGKAVQRKIMNTIPHDVGLSSQEPLMFPNGFSFHDTSKWKDLPSKFVLQVFRDAWTDGGVNEEFLRDMYDTCRMLILNLLKFDKDNDGIIENEATSDQTYDLWIMTGASAYCGGLWLASLFAMTKIAERLGKQEDLEKFQNILDKGRKSFEEKLWNGKFYNFDCSENNKKIIMADQLAGHWYLRNCGFNYEVFPEENVQKTLRTIYINNIQEFCDGEFGASNGALEGTENKEYGQSQESWLGVTYSLGSLMIFEDISNEAFRATGKMYETLTDRLGMNFDFPEALYAKTFYRAQSYMRPLAIWSMLFAYQKTKKLK